MIFWIIRSADSGNVEIPASTNVRHVMSQEIPSCSLDDFMSSWLGRSRCRPFGSSHRRTSPEEPPRSSRSRMTVYQKKRKATTGPLILTSYLMFLLLFL